MQVTADARARARSVATEWEGLTIGSLLPGMAVSARVRRVLADGLVLSFLTFFNGTVDCFHLQQARAEYSALRALPKHFPPCCVALPAAHLVIAAMRQAM